MQYEIDWLCFVSRTSRPRVMGGRPALELALFCKVPPPQYAARGTQYELNRHRGTKEQRHKVRKCRLQGKLCVSVPLQLWPFLIPSIHCLLSPVSCLLYSVSCILYSVFCLLFSAFHYSGAQEARLYIWSNTHELKEILHNRRPHSRRNSLCWDR